MSAHTAEEARQEFLRVTAEIVRLEASDRQAAFRAARRDPGYRHFADLLAEYAAAEADKEQAEQLLDELKEALPVTGGGRGFDFMHAVGEWGEHEVVAIHRHRIPVEIPPEVEAEAALLAERGFDRTGRTDFTSWWTCTIDDDHSDDLDDALSIRATMDGGWECAIHIADPSAYVEAGSVVDQYAARRGTSIYLPTATYPMFPGVLSEGAMSLLAGAERPALTVRVVFDELLDIVDTEICESVVKVDRRLSYAEVDRMLDDYDDRSHVAESLATLRYLADELLMRREEAGAVSIELPEPRLKVQFDEPGAPRMEHAVVRKSASRGLIAEMMILAGERFARWCFERDIPIPFRAQARPEREPSDPTIRAVPEGWAREFAMLCCMKKGEVGVRAAPHAGLGVAMYTQATSPIRRYNDLVVQRQVKAALRGEALPYDETGIWGHIAAVEEAAGHAGAAEREARRYWMLQLLAGREGDQLEGVVLDPHGEVLIEELGLRTRAHLRRPGVPGAPVTLRIKRVRPRAGVFLLHE